MEKRRRLEAIWEKAGESIGCEGVPGVEHEAKMMVEELSQIRAMIKETEDKIEELCKEFAAVPLPLDNSWFWYGCVGPKGIGSDRRSGSISEWETGIEDGWIRPQCGSKCGKDSDRAIPEISKRGKADLRYALYQAAFIASTSNRDFMRYYTRKL